MLNNWFKKEKPFAGFAGFGGGATGLGFAGGGVSVEATGGIKYWHSSENGGTMYHIFQSPGTFNVTNDGDVEVLIVGGGGSGADGQAGGGGGGGVVHGATIPVTGSIPIAVGAGGEPNGPGGNYSRCGYRGGSSSFDGVTAIGGGGGVRNNYAWGGLSTDDQNRVSGANGGGGGGGSLSGSGQNFPSSIILPQPVPSSYVAYGGNYGAPASTVGGGSGGGGGGAGANSPGPAAPRGVNVGSPGGAGKAIPSFNSTNIPIMPSSWITAVGPTGLYGGGGGGGEDGPGGSGLGGPGGGGHGQSPSSYPNSAVVFTGGGGGDRGAPSLPHEGTAGAKGVVIVKYKSAVTSDVTKVFGGEIFTIGNYNYHVFSAGAGELLINSAVTCDILMVAGGGAGGSDRNAGAAGGGGGGGLIYVENHPLAAATWKVWVGNGGVAQPDASARSNPGENTILTAESTIPSNDRGRTSDTWGYPATTLIALGGGGGACTNNNNNENGFGGGTGGGGGSTSGSGGAGVQTNQPSLPAVSKSSGNGTPGRNSGSYPARGGGGGGHSNSYGQGNQYQGGANGYQVPSSFLPTSVPADFANLLGANHPTPKGGGIATNSPEWTYFAGGGGGSDNVPATSNSFQGSGGLGGGGNAGGNGRTSPSNPRTAITGSQYYNPGNETAPGVNGRGGGGAANGLDDSGNSYEYFGGTGGNGIIIIKVPR